MSSRNSFDFPDGFCGPGSFNVLFPGEGRPSIFKGLSSSSSVAGRNYFQFLNSIASLGNYATAGKGSIFPFIALSALYIGTGPVSSGPAGLTGTATTTLTMRLRVSGSYVNAASGPFTVGLVKPGTVTVAAMTPILETAMTGSRSFRITRIRSTTGGESVASVQSASVTFAAQSARLTFPALDSNGQDRWGVYSTLLDFSLAGPHYFYTEIADSALSTIGGVARSYEVGFHDGQLTDILAPTDHFPPPVGTHGGALETVLFVAGCYGDSVTTSDPGNAIACSLPGYPEAFLPENVLYLPEPPTAVISRAADGYVFVFCANSLHALTYTGGTPPLALQTLWPDVGIRFHHNACTAEGVLYCWTEKRGAVRLGQNGEPDTSFAARISGQMDGWSAENVVVGYAPDDQLVYFIHNYSMLIYNKAADMWSTPVDLRWIANAPAGVAAGCYTFGGNLHVSYFNDTKYTGNGSSTTAGSATLELERMNYNPGTTVQNWEVRSGWRNGGAPGKPKLIKTFWAAIDEWVADVKLRVFTNLNNSTVAMEKTLPFRATTGNGQHSLPKKANVRNARSYSVGLASTGASLSVNPIPLEVYLEGEVSGIVV